MLDQSPDISVVSPVYGCNGCLEELVERVAAAVKSMGRSFEIILVDDRGPGDAWARISELAARHPYVRGLRMSRNFGQHYALSAGIEHAAGQIVVVMDCDLQDVPEEIPKLVDALRDGKEVAFAQRTDRKDGALKRFGSWAFFRLLSWLTGVPQDHTTANFGAYSRKAIDVVNAMPEYDRCFPLMVKWTGFETTTVPVKHECRSEGKSGYGLMKLIRLGIGIVLSYSDKPLRLVVKLGLLTSAVAVAIVLLSVYRYLTGDIAVAGFTSIIASIWLLGGVVIFCIGISGLYVGRIFNDTKRRPYYIVSERLNVMENRN